MSAGDLNWKVLLRDFWTDFKAAIEGDMKALAASGEKGLLQLVMVSHAGMTSDEFTRIVKDWLATAKHPKLNRPYTDLVYQPMLEVLALFRQHGFRNYLAILTLV